MPSRCPWCLSLIHIYVGKGSDDTLFALVDGTVRFERVGKLNSDTDSDVGINNLLATVNGYFQADRTYVFEIDPDRDVLINT